MERESVLKIISGLAITGLVAFELATAPVTGTGTAPISAGLPWTAGVADEQIALASASSRDAAMLQRAFSPRATELLGSWILDLAPRDPESRINVQLSADAVDSTVLHPDEVFSFNEIVGIRTADRGYQAGFMFSNGEVVTGVGGGICITSTAIYNVALETGMTIVERHHHSGPVAYAEPGRDSAVAYGSLDLRFRNNTGAVVLIRSLVQNGRLVVAFYGKSQPERQIEIRTEDFEPIPYEVVRKTDESVPEGETVIDAKGRPGHSVTTVRIVRKNGKVVSREMISRDVVRPRNEVVLVHAQPGDSEPTSGDLDLLTIPTYVPRHRALDVPLPIPEPELPSVDVPLPDTGSQGSGEAGSLSE